MLFGRINMKTKITTTLIIGLGLFIPILSNAAGLSNGDFQTGDFSSWSQDVDGLGDIGLNDFTIVEPTSGDYAARIEADYWDTPGDTFSTPLDEVFFANTLYQTLDLTASAGQDLVLSFDWSFNGQDSFFDEYFMVGLGDGSGDYYGVNGLLGSLISPLEYGSGTYTAMLDSSFINATNWTLEFQMNAGFDGYGSYAEIDNITLEAVTPQTINNVPEPSAFFLLSIGLVGFAGTRRKKS